MGKTRLAAAAVAAFLGIIVGAVQAAAAATLVVAIPLPNNPESITIDHKGDIFMSAPFANKVLELKRGAAQPATFVTLPSNVLGVRLDEEGNLFAAVVGVGLFEVAAGTQTPVKVAAAPAGAPEFFWNGMAFDHRGNLFVSESHFGEVWRLGRDGSFTKWASSPLLVGTLANGPCGLPHPAIAAGFGIIGANGIFFDKHSDMLVNNTDLGTVVRIPVGPKGDAGTPRVFAGPSCTLWGADGGAFDNDGDLLIAANAANKIVKVDARGHFSVVTSGAPLNFPTDIAFGTGRGERKVGFITNLAVQQNGTATDGSLVSLDLGEPGRPMP